MHSPQQDYKKHLQLLVRHKERFVVIALVLMTLIFAVSFLLPRKYQASSTVFIEKNVISELVKGITVTPSMEDTISVLTYAITSRTLISKVVDSLDMNLSKSEGETEALIKELQKKTTVKTKDKNLFSISFEHENPSVARDYVNTLVRLYIEENTSSKRGESYDATQFLSEQIKTFNEKLEKAEQEVNTYKREKGGVIAIDEGKLFEEINIAQQKLYDIELKRRQLEGMRHITQKAGDPLQSRMIALQKRLDELRVEYTDSYPEVVKVKGDIETVKEQMRSRGGTPSQPLDPQELAKIESEISALKVTEKGLQRYIGTNRALLQSIPSAKAGLDKLELERQNQKNIYDQLFARHGQSEVSKQMEVQDKSTTFRIVDPAVLPVKPSSPNRLSIMLLGIAGAVAASFGLLFLLDQMDGSVKGIETARSFGAPLLAVIPRMQEPAQERVRQKKARRLLAVAGVYFLLILCFPAMELMGAPYMDKLLDRFQTIEITRSAKDLLQERIK